MVDLIGSEAVREGPGGVVVDGLVRDAVELIDLEVPGPLSRVLPGWSAQGPCGNPRHRLPWGTRIDRGSHRHTWYVGVR